MVDCTLLGILLTICLIPHQSESRLTIESTALASPQDFDCNKIKFTKLQFITCVCVEGVWAFQITSSNSPQSHWKILGGDNKHSRCYQVGQWVSQIRKISSQSTKPSIRRLKDNSNKFIVTNTHNWQINLIDDKQKRQKLCLQGAQPNHYCIYKIQSSSIPLQEKSFVSKDECSPDAIKVGPLECSEFIPTIIDDEPLVCDLVPPQIILKRQKRDETEKTSKKTTPMSGPELDEDYISPESRSALRGNEHMMSSIIGYMRLAVAKILELSTGRTKRSATSPVAQLLRVSNDIMKKICSPINADIFNVALESFIKLQKDTYHIKEPYISYTSFVRVLTALEKCSAWAKPIIYQRNITVTDDDFYCDTVIPGKTSNYVIIEGQNTSIPTFPSYADARPGYQDPVIETVWKVFLSAHSYCYRFFEEYYNDHHTLTVSLMPFFTNEIQDVWLLNQGNEQSNNNDGGDKVWYGNMLGNITELFKSIDNCYGGSRLYSQYPWFLKRPLKQTNRRKRSVEPETALCD